MGLSAIGNIGSSVGALRYGLAAATIPLSLMWGSGSVLAHLPSAQNNQLGSFLASNQHALAAAIFGTVSASAFLNLYPLRTLVFGLASIISLAGHILNKSELQNAEENKQKVLEFVEPLVIGFLGLAAASKGFILGVPGASKNAQLSFPKVDSFSQVSRAWKNNFSAELKIMQWNFKNYSTLCRDFIVGLGSGLKNSIRPAEEFKNLSLLERFRGAVEKNAPNCYRGAFQITALMRLMACGTMLAAIFSQKENDSSDNGNAASHEPEKPFSLNSLAAWLVSLSLIPAAVASLSKNNKWGAVPNLLFNASSLLAIPGVVTKFLNVGEIGKAAGGLCTKLLIATQMLAYALSQCLK